MRALLNFKFDYLAPYENFLTGISNPKRNLKDELFKFNIERSASTYSKQKL